MSIALDVDKAIGRKLCYFAHAQFTSRRTTLTCYSLYCQGVPVKMINAVVVMNTHGQPRLTKFYEYTPEDRQQQFIRDAFSLLSRRADGMCNFIHGGTDVFGPDVRLIYRHYATLYFVFCVDKSESELGMLDLIQVFVETLDRCFENVCELDLIFHMDKINFVLDELVVGGLVLETNMADILEALAAAKRTR
jgi:AP-3 complex subunit sigma